MKYAHLDSLPSVDDDDDELTPCEVLIYIQTRDVAGFSEASIAGYPGMFLLNRPDAMLNLGKLMQRHVDSLSNSATALFLEQNHLTQTKAQFQVRVRVPKIIITEVQRG